MARGDAVPEEGRMLCEGCGYILDGLGAGACCPECGLPAGRSSPDLRGLPPWEARDGPAVSRFLRTTARVLFHPRSFFRGLATRRPPRAARTFARIHWLIAAVLLGIGAFLHLRWSLGLWNVQVAVGWAALLGVVAVIYGFQAALARIAARASAWEAAQRGLRLPYPVILRGMYYHAAHYLPVAMVGFATMAGYRLGLQTGLITELLAPYYLYTLAAEVILAAVYLFEVYWIGMRQMMYANA